MSVVAKVTAKSTLVRSSSSSKSPQIQVKALIMTSQQHFQQHSSKFLAFKLLATAGAEVIWCLKLAERVPEPRFKA